MSDTATDQADQLPSGMHIPEGESPEEAAAGLFEALGSEEEFEEPEESEQSSGEVEGDDAVSEEEEEFEEAGEADEDDETFEDESDEDGDEADGDAPELSDELVVEGVPLPGGETTEVTLAELKAGYSRTQDYTQKRQRDAAEHAEAMTELGEVREQYKAHLDAFKSMLSEAAPEKPSEELRQKNPGEWSAQMAEFQEYQDRISAIGTAEQAIDAEVQQEQLQAQQDYLAEQWNILLSEVPSWKDESTRNQEMGELRKHALSRGFSEQEVDSLADARLLLMLRENLKLQKQREGAQETVEKKKGKAEKRLNPGGRTRKGKRTKSKKRQKAADQRLQETGSIKDAAASIELLLGDED